MIDGNYLCGPQEWKNGVELLTSPFEDLETNKERIKRSLAKSILDSVKQKAGHQNALLFSGGVDSTLLATILSKSDIPFTCITVGFGDAQDVQWAKKTAEHQQWNIEYKILSLQDLEFILKQVVSVLKTDDLVKISVGVVTFAGCAVAKKLGFTTVFSGLGSEELFAGYQRHLDSFRQGLENVHRECMNGLVSMHQRDLVRDFTIASHFRLALVMPFLDKNVVKIAMSTHPLFKINQEQNKILIREIAQDIGVSSENALRDKKAAQYGSKVVLGIEKLAKQKGFTSKKEYVKSLQST